MISITIERLILQDRSFFFHRVYKNDKNRIKMSTILTKQVSDRLEMMEELCKIGGLDITYYNRCLDFCSMIYDRDKVNDLNIEELIENCTIQPLLVYQIFKDEPELIDPEGLTPWVFENLEKLKEKPSKC